MGFGAHEPVEMIVTTTPEADLALTNLAYCCPDDLLSFAVPGTDLFLANVADSFIISLSPHESIKLDHIALNAIQRRHARVSTGDSVSVCWFLPPDDFDLVLLSLELEFVKRGTKNEQIDAILLAGQLKKKFVNQVMTVGQRVSFEYHGNNYIFTVNQASVEGQETSNTPERGMITNDTYIVFEASSASGIKIVNQSDAGNSKIFKRKEFNLQSLGIGGLSAEFADIFRRVFEDAYRSPLSFIILDDIERLLEFSLIGPQFSNLILQTLFLLVRRIPPKGKKLLVMGTTSEMHFLESIGFCNAFSVTHGVPTLNKDGAKRVLEQLDIFSEDDIDAASEALNDMPIKKLYTLIKMAAAQGRHGRDTGDDSGKQKIQINHFFDCLQDITPY